MSFSFIDKNSPLFLPAIHYPSHAVLDVIVDNKIQLLLGKAEVFAMTWSIWYQKSVWFDFNYT